MLAPDDEDEVAVGGGAHASCRLVVACDVLLGRRADLGKASFRALMMVFASSMLSVVCVG